MAMTPDYYEWTLVRWERLNAEPPQPLERGAIEIDGEELDVSARPPADWVTEHTHHGAVVFDPRRNLSYRVTLDPRTREIDHLEVIVEGAFEVGLLRGRQISLPIERLQKAVREFVIDYLRADAEAGRQVIAFVLPGGLEDGDGSMRKPPPSEEIARLMGELKYDRGAVAAHYGRELRTVDRWIAKARKELPELMPPARRGRAPKTPGAVAPVTPKKNGEEE